MFINNFYTIAAQSKDKPAIITSDNVLTYQDLKELVNKIRAILRSGGLSSRRSPILLLGNRDEYLVSLMLALYFEKIPYIPLSKEYPMERIEYIAQKTHANLLLSNDIELVSNLKSDQFESFEIFNLPINLEISVTSNIVPTTGYIIFTSGSTGNPKGVEISYSSVENFLEWIKKNYDDDDFKLLFAGTEITFDLSVFEIFGTLNFGGTFIFGKSILEFPLYEYHGVTLLNTVPSAIRELAAAKKIPKSLRKINLAGEALSSSVIREIKTVNSNVKIINLYGPTENTTYSTCFQVPHDFREADIPIGQPIDGVRIMILNSKVGFTQKSFQKGEIIIMGDLLANGYVNDSQKTNNSFQYMNLKNNKERFYKTGDLGFFDKNGDLHYLGRSDSQIKYHGFRIELREIEILAEKNEAIKKAIVLIKNDNLTLYYSLNRAYGKYDVNRLKTELVNKLPAYMVPKKIIFIESWPLNSNGKIDRNKLLKKDRYSITKRSFKYTDTDSNTVASIWKSLLEIDVDSTTEFFKDGGNSIKAMRLVSEISRQLHKEINLSDVFQNPQFSEFLKMISSVKITEKKVNDMLNDFQKRLMLQYDVSSDGDEYMIKFKLAFKKEINISIFNMAIFNTISLWPHLLMKVERLDDNYVFVNDKDLEEFKLQLDDEQEKNNINPYDGSLIRSYYSRNKQTIKFCISHLVFDGYSVNIFVDRLMSEYRKILFKIAG